MLLGDRTAQHRRAIASEVLDRLLSNGHRSHRADRNGPRCQP
jgi:hypothetical protein